jgi:hypothetical protein
MKHKLLWFTMWLCRQTWAQGSEQAAMQTIWPEAIRAHMRLLSESLLEGQGSGTGGCQSRHAMSPRNLKGWVCIQPA